jgi:spermidine/putrescine transport system permease protein
VSATATAAADDAVTVSEAPRPRPKPRWWKGKILPVYTGLVIFYLVIPILVMVLYSFNVSPARLPQVSFKWLGFTLRWYREWNGIPGLITALSRTLIVATTSSITAAAIGTLVALALVRYRFRGKVGLEQVMFMNIAAPEIVMGASLLGFFVTLGVNRGFTTLYLAHVTFSIAYVAITVRARLAGFDRSLEEAAQDLGADPWVTFRKITLPLIWPGVLAGALMAFALSIDDFVISNFVFGNYETFPLWVYGAVRVGIPPQVFVLGTVIFLVGLTIAASNLVLHRKKT